MFNKLIFEHVKYIHDEESYIQVREHRHQSGGQKCKRKHSNCDVYMNGKHRNETQEWEYAHGWEITRSETYTITGKRVRTW